MVLIASARAIAGLCFVVATAYSEDRVKIAPVSVAVKRDGITGAGRAVVAGDGRHVTLHYPNHPDDFGGSGGTGTALSSDGGITWSAGADDWPMPKMVDLWQDRLRDDSHVAFGIRWTPDPKKRGTQTAADVPADAYSLAISKDAGRTWSHSSATLRCPPEIGIIARPLPRIFEDRKGTWLMPAYAWGKTGTRALLLRSLDQGRTWDMLSVITSAAAIVKAGTEVTTPWLETTVEFTRDGSLLAVIRTGSSEKSALVIARSTDAGATWSPVEKLITGPQHEAVAGKLPSLQLMPNGTLVLLAAHTKLGCFIHLSRDGNGREWSAAQVITPISGGNTSMLALDADTLLVFTPSNKTISSWKVTVPAPNAR